MDLSALIFVALAVAWAAYLVPKALRHHEEDADARDVDGFSDRLRVLARRDAVSATRAALVEAGRAVRRSPDADGADAADEVPVAAEPAEEGETRTDRTRTRTRTRTDHTDRSDRSVRPASRPSERPALSPEERRRRRVRQVAARRAARRRRRVLLVLLLAVAVVGGVAAAGTIAPVWTSAPAGVVVAWLVLCRLMVRGERAARTRRRRTTLADEVIADEDALAVEDTDLPDDATDYDLAVTSAELDPEATGEIPVVAPVVASTGWAPVQVPLPTYVVKAPAGRTVRTIDLDSTGVWSSGRSEVDSALAREADARRADEAAAETGEDQRRASGS